MRPWNQGVLWGEKICFYWNVLLIALNVKGLLDYGVLYRTGLQRIIDHQSMTDENPIQSRRLLRGTSVGFYHSDLLYEEPLATEKWTIMQFQNPIAELSHLS